MKRVLVLVFVLMACWAAFAEGSFGIDWTALSDDELKAVIAQLSAAIDEANTELSSRSNGSQVYHVGNVDFTARFYKYDGALSYTKGEAILVEIEWKNVSEKAIKFQNSVIVKAYQDGKAMGSMPLIATQTPTKSDEMMPGYGDTNYAAFKLNGDSDVTVMISDLWNAGNADKSITFTVAVSGLEDYE